LVVLDIAEELRREGHAFEMQFIGGANPRDQYAAEFLRRISLAEQSGFAAYTASQSLPELIASFDNASVLVHVPLEEAFGLVAAEALARGLKLFGTDVGGLRDIARDTDGAELFPLGDEASLRAAIGHWLRKDCPRPANAAAEMKKRYHPDVIAAQHSQIYHAVAST